MVNVPVRGTGLFASTSFTPKDWSWRTSRQPPFGSACCFSFGSLFLRAALFLARHCLATTGMRQSSKVSKAVIFRCRLAQDGTHLLVASHADK